MLVSSGAVGGGFSLMEDRASGFLRALLVAPVSRTHLVLAKLVARTGVSVLLVAGLASCSRSSPRCASSIRWRAWSQWPR